MSKLMRRNDVTGAVTPERDKNGTRFRGSVVVVRTHSWKEICKRGDSPGFAWERNVAERFKVEGRRVESRRRYTQTELVLQSNALHVLNLRSV